MMEDDGIEAFFKGMKKADERLAAPAFRQPAIPARRKSWPVFYAAAGIAVVVIVSVFMLTSKKAHEQQEHVVILVGPDTMKTNSLMEDKSFSEWDSPTRFLAEDF